MTIVEVFVEVFLEKLRRAAIAALLLLALVSMALAALVDELRR